MPDKANIFDDVTLEWDGVSYVIPSRRILGAIAVVEEVITLQELSERARKKKVPISLLSQAFGALLRYAGSKVTDDEVYQQMFSDEATEKVIVAVHALMMMMVPREVKEKAAAARKGKPKPVAVNS